MEATENINQQPQPQVQPANQSAAGQRATLSPFDVSFKTTVNALKPHFWGLLGLYFLMTLASVVIIFVMLLPAVVFGILAFNARGTTLDIYILLGLVFIVFALFAIVYIGSVFVKTLFSVFDAQLSPFHALEQALGSSGALMKTVLTRFMFVSGYTLVFLAFVTLLGAGAFMVERVLVVLVILLALPLMVAWFWMLTFFAFTLMVTANDSSISGVSALAESFRLVRHNFWGVFGRLMLLKLILVGIGMLISTIQMPLSLMGMFNDNVFFIQYPISMLFNFFANFLGTMLTFAYLYFIFKELTAQKPRPQDYGASKIGYYIFVMIGTIFTVSILLGLGVGLKYAVETKVLEQFGSAFKQGFEQQYSQEQNMDAYSNELDLMPPTGNDLNININGQQLAPVNE